MKRIFIFCSLLVFLFVSRDSALAQTITTIAGGGSVSGVSATASPLPYPIDIAFDGSGNKYIVCNGDGTVRKITTANVITTVAGGGTGTLTDGALATNGPLLNPTSIAVDASGNLYITEWGGVPSSRIRKVSSGIITTIAGTGTSGYNGDGFAATSAQLNFPTGIMLDGTGNIYFADFLNNRVRKINSAGVITTVAGNGIAGYNGDGIAATAAQLNLPSDLAKDAFGNIRIADYGNNRVRTLLTNGVILTSAGTGVNGFSGDGGAATSAQLSGPWGIVVDGGPNDIYVSCQGDNRLRKITGGSIISTIAGSGVAGYSGDGNAATLAQTNGLWGMALNASGSLFIADEYNHRIRQINTSGIISTVAGNGANNANGDGGPAANAILSNLSGIAADRAGNTYFADGNRVRKVTPAGIITTFAGVSAGGYSGDGGPAINAQLNQAYGVYADAPGNVYISTAGDYRIRKVNTAGIISTIAGTGNQGFTGDGGLAVNATVSYVKSMVTDASGNFYFTEVGNGGLVRKINPAGVLSTIAGTGNFGYSGDGGPATAAALNGPNGLSTDAVGNIYVSDFGNKAVRKITTAGIITTVAGGSSAAGNTGDGGLATAALFNGIEGTVSDANGNLYIVDGGNNRIRKVNAATGIITAFAGTGSFGFTGDGGAAAAAQLAGPRAIAQDTAGNIYVVDYGNARVRKITLSYTLFSANTTVNQAVNGNYSVDINDNSYHRLATVLPTAGANALNGNVSFKVRFDAGVQTYNGKPYVQRHYDIDPSTNAASAQATVKLYFLQSEFDAYNSYVTANTANVPLLPTGGINNGSIIINQYHGTGTAPGNYSGNTVNISPAVVWNSTSNWWEVSFPVSGFSGFYLSTANTPLPLTLVNFTGTLQNNSIMLKWRTTGENNVKDFAIERSTDPAMGFVAIGFVAALNAAGTNSHGFTDNSLLSGISFYRLKINDRDGRYRYSDVISLKTTGIANNILVYPNPVKDRLYVQLKSGRSQSITVQITDVKGTILKQQQIQTNNGSTGFSINTETLPAGNYLLICSGDNHAVSAFVKQ